MKNVLILCISSILLLFQSCYYDNEEELYEFYYLQNNCDSISSISFTNDIMPIVQGNCSLSGCHIAGGSGNGIFESYAGIKAKVDNGSLHQRVVVEKSMPPSQPLNSCQINKIHAWINAGAPNN